MCSKSGWAGRLDATNVVTPALSVITPIDLDHQFFLGDTIEKIAAEKAGILKPGVPAIFAEQLPEAETVLRAHAQVPYTLTRDWAITDLNLDARGSGFRLRDMDIVCPLAGQHQVENARTAAVALQTTQYLAGWHRSNRLARKAGASLSRSGNHFGWRAQSCRTRALADYIGQFYAGRRIWIIYGVMRDKAVGEMTSLLFPLADRVILTAPDNSRAMPPEEIPAPGATITHNVRDALALLSEAAPSDVIIITGSLSSWATRALVGQVANLPPIVDRRKTAG